MSVGAAVVVRERHRPGFPCPQLLEGERPRESEHTSFHHGFENSLHQPGRVRMFAMLGNHLCEDLCAGRHAQGGPPDGWSDPSQSHGCAAPPTLAPHHRRRPHPCSSPAEPGRRGSHGRSGSRRASARATTGRRAPPSPSADGATPAPSPISPRRRAGRLRRIRRPHGTATAGGEQASEGRDVRHQGEDPVDQQHLRQRRWSVVSGVALQHDDACKRQGLWARSQSQLIGTPLHLHPCPGSWTPRGRGKGTTEPSRVGSRGLPTRTVPTR